MLRYIILIGISIPLIELLLLLWISNVIGFWPTIGIVAVTGLLGATLWRFQGLGTLGRLKNRMRSGGSPGDAIMDGAMIFFAGGMLLTPGVLTDLFGFALLIPLTRNAMKKRLSRFLQTRFEVMHFSSFGSFGEANARASGAESESRTGDDPLDQGDVVEGYVVDPADDTVLDAEFKAEKDPNPKN